MDTLSVTVADGKYTVQQDEFGRLSALRYGEEWEWWHCNALVLALAQEVERLRKQYDKHIAEPAMQELVFQTQAEENYQKLLEAEKVIAELRAEVTDLKQAVYNSNLNAWGTEPYHRKESQ